MLHVSNVSIKRDELCNEFLMASLTLAECNQRGVNMRGVVNHLVLKKTRSFIRAVAFARQEMLIYSRNI